MRPVIPGRLLTVDFNLMKKIINILLFLFYINAAAYTQNFNLTDKGLMEIQIGDTLNLQGNRFIKPVTERLDFLRIFFWDIEHIDYYYIEHTGGNITLDSAIIVKDIFLYTEKIKGKELGGMFFFIDRKYDSLLVARLNRVFGSLQGEASGGAEGVELRRHRFWEKEQIQAFVTDNYTNLLKVAIVPLGNDRRAAGVRFRD